jgi:hypothetical protein
MTSTAAQDDAQIIARLAEIKPVLTGWRRGLAVRILDPKKGPPLKGWQADAQEIIDHHNAEVLRNLGYIAT